MVVGGNLRNEKHVTSFGGRLNVFKGGKPTPSQVSLPPIFYSQILRLVIAQCRINRNITKNVAHEIENLFDCALHSLDGCVPHEMIHDVTREVNCVNFLLRKN